MTWPSTPGAPATRPSPSTSTNWPAPSIDVCRFHPPSWSSAWPGSAWPWDSPPRSAAEHDLQTGTLVEVTITDLPPWHVEIMLAHHRDRAEEPAIRTVLSAVDGRG